MLFYISESAATVPQEFTQTAQVPVLVISLFLPFAIALFDFPIFAFPLLLRLVTPLLRVCYGSTRKIPR